MNAIQIQAVLHHLLSVAGSIVGMVALFNPEWGTKGQVIIGALGTIIASSGVIWATLTPHATAASGLTGAEATAALNRASYLKSVGEPQ